MKSRKGFTLIELMVVVLIVAVLAALVVPLLLSRVEKARYSEGKAIASQIATAARTYAVESDGTPKPAPDLVTDLGFRSNELDAKWFRQSAGTMTVTGLVVNADGTMDYVVTLVPNDTAKLTKGSVVLSCDNNVSTFTNPVGL